ncbi:amino acid adenylation domain-containing protein [Duganella sp. FT92W]|uniref:Amino acid adenylation domain-containing protein n=1 Tax=Pseudoduganella rivuli TaxID=2666085 RepID=A0A7X2ILL9_9BURK|nr:non-ribosomal peptide synthetase [Pseudoduganella rivuli]MRV71998.1 amino acid adenylation domain-containing protein [Pseudoduganella rivuli]
MLTFIDIIQRNAAVQPEKAAYIFLADGEREEARLTFRQLQQQCEQMAGQLLRRVAPGARVLLVMPQGKDYVLAFYACLRAGLVAVPAYPPRAGRHALERLERMVADCMPDLLLTSQQLLDRLGDNLFAPLTERFACPVLALEALAGETTGGPLPDRIDGRQIAFLQYTSGSSGDPKGVMVSHANLLANQRLIQRAFGHTSDSVVVGWLPLFHDMGLIGNLLQPFFVGGTSVLMTPAAFVQQPVRWLRAIAAYRAHSSGGPNFAYRLCAEKISEEQLQGLDLSSWKVAFNGAEKVQADTLKAFARRTAPCGFRFDSFFPCYGMAETTLFVSGATGQVRLFPADTEALANDRYVPRAGAPELVGVGGPEDPGMVAIVDAHGHRLPPDHVGELWVRHPSVALGYWGREDLSATTFHASLEAEHGRWLRTGDRGFLHDGELVITGRIKEMIILRGRNYYPQDIEETVRLASPELQADSGAVFSIEQDGEEQLVVVQEVRRGAVRGLDVPALTARIRQRIAQAHELAVFDVVLIQPLSMLKTSSGKNQRLAMKAAYLANQLKVVTSAAPGRVPHPAAQPGGLAAQLAVLLEQIAGHGAGHDVQQFALDSIRMLELQHQIERRFGARLDLVDMLAADSVPALAALLEARLASAPAPGGHGPAAAEEGAHDDAPPVLAANQQGIWIDQLAHPGSTRHLLAAAFRLDHGPDAAAIAGIVAQQLQRHAQLRVRFALQAGAIVPTYGSGAGAFTCHPETAPEAVDAALHALLSRPMASSDESLYQVHCWPSAPAQVTVLLLVHHALADAASVQQLALELAGAPVRSSAPYRQFALAHVARPEVRTAQAEPEPLNLPRELGLDAACSGHAASHAFPLDAAAGSAVAMLAARCKTTVHHVLQAAFAIVLSRYAQQDTVHVGMPVSLRRNADFAQTVGYFIAPQGLDYNVAGADSFAGLLDASRPAFYRKLEQAVPAGKPYQAMFTYLKAAAGVAPGWLCGAGGETLALHDAVLTSVPLPAPGLQSELDLTIADGAGVMAGRLVYPADTWPPETAAQFAADWVRLLAVLCDAPDAPLWQCRTSAPPACAVRQAAPDAAPGLLDAIAAHAHSDLVAVRCRAHQLSYRQLWRRSGTLAAALRRHGAGPEVTIAIDMQASVFRLVAILAVLRAGAAYVPLDLRYPAERKRFILHASGARLLLTDTMQPELAGAAEQWDQGAMDALPPADFPAMQYPAQRLAYVIFTSGSTGQPKGVAVTWANIEQLYRWTRRVYAPADFAHVLAATSPCFDISVFELLMPLAVGGCVSVLDSVLDIGDLPEAATISLLNSVPSAVEALLDNDLLPPALAVANLAGEPLSRHLVARLRARGVGRIHNLYGPSEDTVYSTWAEVGASAGKPLIGQPIDDTQAYLLDRWLNPVPHGAIGELYLGGPGVSRGYLTSSSQSAERFLPDPFTDSPGQRMYRTGDLVRQQRDGALEFIGRADTQTKLRGQRIELEEIESHLAALPDVEQAVVAVQGAQISACVVARGGRFDPAAAHDALARQLPPYMLPARYTVLAELPRLLNGKVDRKALPVSIDTGAFQAPRPGIEQRLADIWRTVLQCGPVSRDAGFFELGGHSLLMLKVKHAVETEWQVQITVSDLMSIRTVADLAQLIADQQAAARTLGALIDDNTATAQDEFVL